MGRAPRRGRGADRIKELPATRLDGTERRYLVITADGFPTALRVTEEGLASRVHWSGEAKRASR